MSFEEIISNSNCMLGFFGLIIFVIFCGIAVPLWQKILELKVKHREVINKRHDTDYI